MFIFFLALFGAEQTPCPDAFASRINLFDFNDCASYSTQSSYFLNTVQPDFSVYLPKQFWTRIHTDHDQLKCFIITNGEEGRQYFFDKLFSQGLTVSGWRFTRSNNKKTESFIGIVSPDEKTFAAVGLYKELFSSGPKKEQYRPCLAGRLYYLRAQRAADDQEFAADTKMQGLTTAFGENLQPEEVPAYLERMGGWYPGK